MAYDVVGVGHAAVDYLGVVPRYPRVDTKVQLLQFSIQGGGPVATAMVTLAAFGLPVTFCGKVSDDDFGRFIKRGLAENGVNVDGLVIEPGRISPFSFISVESQGGRRNIFWTVGNVSPLEPEELDLSILEGAKFLLVDGHQMKAQLVAAQRAREMGITVILDAGHLREGMGDLVALTDILIASERFAWEVSPAGGLEKALQELCRMGPPVVVITMGEEGSIGLDHDVIVRQPALDVDVADTTGAGDVYHGAFIYGLYKDMDLESCMAFASAAAGLKCRFLGGRAGIPTLSEVHAALAAKRK